MSDLTGFVTGLSKSLDNYLGMKNQYEILGQYQQQKTAAEMQKEMGVEQFKSNLKLNQEQTMELYKMALAGKIDPEAARSMSPKAAEFVDAFNESNKRLPTVDEFKNGFKDPEEKSAASDANRELRFNNITLQWSDKMNKHPQILKMQDHGLNLDTLNVLAESAQAGNTIAANAMGTKAARAMGEVGVLTDMDVRRYVESGKLTRAAGDRLSKWIAGRPTDATLEEIKQIGPMIKEVYTKKVAGYKQTYVNQLAANLGISKEEAAKRLDVDLSPLQEDKPAKPSKADPLGLGI